MVLANQVVEFVQTQFRREQLLLDRRLQMPRQSVRVTSVVHPLPQRQLARVVEEATPIHLQQVVPIIAEVVSRSHTLLRGSSEQQIAQLASRLQMA
jgi:hypothetical protein